MPANRDVSLTSIRDAAQTSQMRKQRSFLTAVVNRQNGIVTLAREERERTIRGTDFHAAATTSRHVVIAAARSTRCD
jgi:hypothetical protein